MVDTRDLKSLTARCAGSIPALGTILRSLERTSNGAAIWSSRMPSIARRATDGLYNYFELQATLFLILQNEPYADKNRTIFRTQTERYDNSPDAYPHRHLHHRDTLVGPGSISYRHTILWRNISWNREKDWIRAHDSFSIFYRSMNYYCLCDKA